MGRLSKRSKLKDRTCTLNSFYTHALTNTSRNIRCKTSFDECIYIKVNVGNVPRLWIIPGQTASTYMLFKQDSSLSVFDSLLRTVVVQLYSSANGSLYVRQL